MDSLIACRTACQGVPSTTLYSVLGNPMSDNSRFPCGIGTAEGVQPGERPVLLEGLDDLITALEGEIQDLEELRRDIDCGALESDLGIELWNALNALDGGRNNLFDGLDRRKRKSCFPLQQPSCVCVCVSLGRQVWLARLSSWRRCFCQALVSYRSGCRFARNDQGECKSSTMAAHHLGLHHLSLFVHVGLFRRFGPMGSTSHFPCIRQKCYPGSRCFHSRCFLKFYGCQGPPRGCLGFLVFLVVLKSC